MATEYSGWGDCMRFNLRSIPPEILIAGATLAIILILSLAFGLPIMRPSGNRAEFVGIHYIYPLIGVALLGIATLIAGKRDVATGFLVAMPCYVTILFAHFNIKLWIPHINPVQFDDFYFAIDQALRPLIDLCIFVRLYLFGFISYESNFYMTSFIAMFYCSFLYHAIKTPRHFRPLVVAVLLLQSLGGLSYLIAPAIGPFLFERGVDPSISEGQLGMLEIYRQSVAVGPDWIAQHGSTYFTAGLAAMPSLHAAGAFLFFLFACRHGRILVPLYSIILFFILTTAVASRWHYLIDLPVGMALAWFCIRLSERIVRPSQTEASTEAVAGVPATG